MLLLQNKRILITRTRRQASDLAAQLEALGAIPVLVPTIEIVPPASYAPLDAALDELESFDWILFTSANAVEVFEERRNRSLQPRRIGVIGPATAKAVQGIGLQVDLVPPQYIAESLAEALIFEAAGKRMLLIRAEQARDVLPETLASAGAQVTIAPAYRNQAPPESIHLLQQLFSSSDSYPDVITFTSASTARNLDDLLKAAEVVLPEGIPLASIGPVTSLALRDLGYEPTIEAAESSLAGLTQAIQTLFRDSGCIQ